ncbi:putative ML-like domain-containing protein [Seiridium unicorne]|uniref:ML-like domain-containing protein n=1 Tax=Seiridium unicorne TaxID=138068 RepID=A0ABR2VB11_9PEZI
MLPLRWSRALALVLESLLIATAFAKNTTYISGTSLDGVTSKLAVDRTPALYTGDFGDCLGGQSLLNVTKFDAALYYDNSTILFHLDGTTNLKSEALMLYISVEAYGQTRFTMAFDPCFVNIYSLCPMNASVPITAFALFQVGQLQVSGIPQIAFEIPDFEGYARIQLFANSSQTEIGCFQAVMRNNASFSQPKAISSILGIFTAIALVASFATAAYGVSIPHMRNHYAHSLSVLVIFETFQSIFFSGALSLNWPSVLSAWWSNFAWAAGFIPIHGMIRSVDSFAGVSGNASQVGGAGSTIINNNGGGLAQQIYGRSLSVESATSLVKRAPKLASSAASIVRRQPYDPNDPYDYNWNGDPVTPGMPIPGDWSGFGGTLSELGIPSPDAFMIGFIWLLIALLAVALLVATLKFSLEGLSKLKWVKQDLLGYFRSHWKGYLVISLLRTFFIAFSSVCIMAMFQFAHTDKTGPTAIAAIVFAIFTIGLGGLAAYALRFRLRYGQFASEPDRILLHRGTILGCIPFLVPIRLSQLREHEFSQRPVGSLPFLRWHFIDDEPDRTRVHQDDAYIKRFGWLYARYRLSRWWYFIFWLAYQFVRACFIGGATTNPLAQIFGLFIVDILALVIIAAVNPYEGQRNTALAVWLLGISKVATTGLSIAFLPDFNLDRIVATVIGVVIIVIQALLTIAVMILILLGAISSWMSLTRNREYFSSERLDGVRIKYFEHIAKKALDKAEPPKQKTKSKSSSSNADEKASEQPKEPHFAVANVRRMSKIEDEDDDYLAEMEPHPVVAPSPFTPRPINRTSRTNSVSSRHSVSSLPRGARGHRASWSSRDFTPWQAEMERPGTSVARRLSGTHTPDQSASSAAGGLRSKTSNASFRVSEAPIPGSPPMTPALEAAEETVVPNQTTTINRSSKAELGERVPKKENSPDIKL